MILRHQEDPEVLFIERARRAGDPWSGHMAFPGGRVEADEDPRSTAERETWEEVGLSLSDAEPLGRLDDEEGRARNRRRGLVISGFVYHLPEPSPVITNHEVEEALWVSLSTLVHPRHKVDYAYPPEPSRTFPGILVGEPDRHVVWGLTYRFLHRFFAITGSPLHDGSALD